MTTATITTDAASRAAVDAGPSGVGSDPDAIPGPLNAMQVAALAKAAEDPDALDTRERLVRAAIEVFLERGYGGTRVQDIARRAGFTSGALYQHFPSRSALLAEAISVSGQWVMEEIVHVVADFEPGGGSVASALARMSTTAPTPLHRLLVEALALASGDAEARNVLGESIARLSSELGRHIELARDGGIVATDVDVDSLCAVFISWLFGAVVLNTVQTIDVEPEQIRSLYERLLSGLLP